LRVEADRQRRPAVVHRNRFARFAELRAARRHFDLALVEHHLHRARALVRQDRHAAHRLRQPIALELDVLVVALRHHALVGGKLAVDHSRDQQPRADLEEQVVLAPLVIDVVVAFGQQPPELGERLARQDRLDVVALGAVVLHVHQRQAMAVGGHEGHVLGPQHELGAVQVKAGVFTGDRKLRLGDHLQERLAVDGRLHAAAGFRQAWKILARQRRHLRAELAARHLHAVAALVGFDVDVAIGQRAHHFVELLRRQRHRTGLVHRRFAAAAQRHFEVGGEQRHFVTRALDQHVGQDRNRVLALYDLLEKLQFPHKIGFPGDQFHKPCLTSEI
jgi:hypothetical protein